MKINSLRFWGLIMLNVGGISFLVSCFSTNTSKLNERTIIDESTNYYIDSFQVKANLYNINKSLLTEKLDSLIDLAHLKQDEIFWDPEFPVYITVEPYLNYDTTYFKLKIGKDYLLNFDPPNIEFSKKYFTGFGVAKYRNLLVRLNGVESMYFFKEEHNTRALIKKDNSSLSFMAYGMRNRKNDVWVEPFYPFVRVYYAFLNNTFMHRLTEVER